MRISQPGGNQESDFSQSLPGTPIVIEQSGDEYDDCGKLVLPDGVVYRSRPSRVFHELSRLTKGIATAENYRDEIIMSVADGVFREYEEALHPIMRFTDRELLEAGCPNLLYLGIVLISETTELPGIWSTTLGCKGGMQ